MARSAAIPLLCVVGMFNATAQTTYIPFCPANVQGNGFIDWSKLPPSPASGPVNITIPVSGVPGLNATLQIPACFASFLPCYSVINSADLAMNNGTLFSVIFSQPVQGVSAQARTIGREGHGFAMSANDLNGVSSIPGPPAVVSSSGFDFPGPLLFSTAPLQIRSSGPNIASVTFQLGGMVTEDSRFDLINLRVQTGSGPDLSGQVPTNGLKEWLRADKVLGLPSIVEFYSPTVLTWPDQSGNHADAVAPSASSAPQLLLDGPNCTPVLYFSGSQMNFTLPIQGLTGMTIILASQSYADPSGYFNSALAWKENIPWGTTFVAPFQTHVPFRFGTGQVNNQPIYNRPVDIGGDFSVTTTIHDHGADSLYVNGNLVLHQTGKNPVITGAGPVATIGAGELNTFFTGNIGEVLIYDRVLSEAERENVEGYLMSKYGVH